MSSVDSEPKKSGFRSFAEFYPFYLSEHRHVVSRGLHFVGTWIAFLCVMAFLVTGELRWVGIGLLAAYGFAWIGHFFFEHNRPATFKHPFYSFAGDWVMWLQLNSGKLKFRDR